MIGSTREYAYDKPHNYIELTLHRVRIHRIGVCPEPEEGVHKRLIAIDGLRLRSRGLSDLTECKAFPAFTAQRAYLDHVLVAHAQDLLQNQAGLCTPPAALAELGYLDRANYLDEVAGSYHRVRLLDSASALDVNTSR